MNANSLPAAGRLIFDELLLQPNLRLRVGEHVVDIGALRVVSRPEHPRLTSKAAAVLVELVRHAGDTVTRERLLDRVWADRVTTPDVLTQAIKELRRAFADDAKPSRYIETIPKVGYRLLAAVSLLDAEPIAVDASAPAAGNDPDLAVADAGDGGGSVPTPRNPALLVVAMAVVALFVIAALVWRLRADAPAREHWVASDVRAITSDPGSELRPALSPDGTRVVYSQLDPTSGATGVDRLMLRAIGQSQAVRLTGRSQNFEEVPTWSPDGSQIAFERLAGDDCTVFIVSGVGGGEREVGACRNFTTHYFDWAPDARSLVTAVVGATAGSMVLTRWDLDTGTKSPLEYARTAEDQDLEAHYSPDGRWLAFRRGLAPFSDLCVMPAAGGPVRQLTQLHSRIRGFTWTRDSRGLVFASNHEGRFTLYSVDLADAGVQNLGVGPAEYPNAARGADVVAFEIPRTTNRLAWVPIGVDNAAPELLAKSTGSDGTPALSPDGNRIAFVSDRSGAPQLWLYDFAESAATPLTDFRSALLREPNWSADGKRVLLTVRGTASPGLIEIDLASRRQRTISKPGQDILSGSYGPDEGSYLLVAGASSRENQLVLLEHAGAGDEHKTLLARGVEHAEIDLALRRVYYTKNAEAGLFARDLAGGDEKFVTADVDTGMLDGWRIVDGKVWFVTKVAWKPTDLAEFDPATGKRRAIAHLDAQLHDVAFSVTPKRDRIVLAPLGIEDTDIGLFKLSATGR